MTPLQIGLMVRAYASGDPVSSFPTPEQGSPAMREAWELLINEGLITRCEAPIMGRHGFPPTVCTDKGKYYVEFLCRVGAPVVNYSCPVGKSALCRDEIAGGANG